MKKYFLVMTFLLSANIANASNVKFCANGSCQNLDTTVNYPQIYTTVYGIFKNGIAKNMGICDSDSLFEGCEKNSINYLGNVGVSETNFQVNALNIVDARINPKNRNLELINDYYTFVNGRRVLCSAAKDVLTLENDEVSLIAKGIKCPYNMQFKSDKDHKYTIRMIDLDKKIIGVEYEIRDYVGADSNPRGYAIMSFRDFPVIDFNEINKAIAQGYTVSPQGTQNPAQNMAMVGITPPPSGMTSHVPMAAPQYNNMQTGAPQYNLQNQYQQQVQQSQNRLMQTQYAPMVPPPAPAQEFSYKSDLPYPWGYYYAPNTTPKETPKKKQIPIVNGEKPKGKNYTVEPLPRTMIEIDTSGNAVKTTVNQPAPTIAVEESVGVFNLDTFNNSVTK